MCCYRNLSEEEKEKSRQYGREPHSGKWKAKLIKYINDYSIMWKQGLAASDYFEGWRFLEFLFCGVVFEI